MRVFGNKYDGVYAWGMQAPVAVHSAVSAVLCCWELVVASTVQPQTASSSTFGFEFIGQECICPPFFFQILCFILP